ncbi:MAG: hypothetical protein ACOY0R_05045 [Chloroflexota bacterium]
MDIELFKTNAPSLCFGRGPDPEMPRTTERIFAERGGSAIEVIAHKDTGKMYRVLWRKNGGAWNSKANPGEIDIIRILREIFSP